MGHARRLRFGQPGCLQSRGLSQSSRKLLKFSSPYGQAFLFFHSGVLVREFLFFFYHCLRCPYPGVLVTLAIPPRGTRGTRLSLFSFRPPSCRGFVGGSDNTASSRTL